MQTRPTYMAIVLSLLIFSMSPAIGDNTIQSGEIRTLATPASDYRTYTASELVPVTDKAMLQGFYWLTPDNGDWYNMISEKIPDLADIGFGSIWSPPMVKTPGGDISRGGYEPYDFYDLGEFDQKGGVETRYGSRAELENMIEIANDRDIAIIADVVINHNVGGDMQYNPYTLTNTPTDFSGVASGKFPRNYTHFHPCLEEEEDNYTFADFPDMCHANQYVHDELIKWGKWLRDEIGFDGWRFDVAAGINSEMLKDWMNEVGGFGVAEYWWGNFGDLTNYLDEGEGTYSAFDFYLMYALMHYARGNAGDMGSLRREGLLWHNRINQAVTFVVNHDTVRDENVNIEINRHLAYAYILTHQGIPSIFWQDYFNPELQPFINAFVKIRDLYADGSTSILRNDYRTYVMQRNGDPGLLFALSNDKTSTVSVEVKTKWTNTVLKELTGQTGSIQTNSEGKVSIDIPPRGYLIYGPGDPVADLLPLPDIETHTSPDKVDTAIIAIDGKLDGWDAPAYMDKKGDTANQRDLHNIYLKHDNDYLYVGFTHGTTLYELDKEITYGIAIDSKEGGSFEEAGVHPNVKFNVGEPDHIFYLKADPNSPWGDLASMEGYSYDDEWSEPKSYMDNYFKMDAVLGLTELKIPLGDIDLEQGGEFSIKVFSSDSTTTNAIDTAPHDKTLEASDGNSWLSMPDKITIEVEITEGGFLPLDFAFTLLLVPVIARLIGKSRKD